MTETTQTEFDAQQFVLGLDIDGHLVGGAVRDELLGRKAKDADFLAPGRTVEQIKDAVAPYGKVEDLVVAGKLVGVRCWPEGGPAEGIEIVPPRKEVSTGPAHTDFDIVADPGVSIAEDAMRRDFTVNAIAKNLATGELVDPLGGAADLELGVLRTTSPTSFRDDPLRIVRGLRFVSQLPLTPDAETLEQMRRYAPGIVHLSGERVAGELMKLLMGPRPVDALRIARDTGALAAMLPELAPSLGFEQESKFHDLTVDEHTFAAVQASADAGDPVNVRLALLLHDSGKPESAWRSPDGRLHYYASAEHSKRAHEDVGEELARRAMNRLGCSNDEKTATLPLIKAHMFTAHDKPTALKARRFVAEHGYDRAVDLIRHKRADVGAKGRSNDTSAAMARLELFERLVRDAESEPTRIADLAIGGDDLIRLGFTPGPVLGETLRTLLAHVVGSPDLNTRDWLEAEAARILRRRA